MIISVLGLLLDRVHGVGKGRTVTNALFYWAFAISLLLLPVAFGDLHFARKWSVDVVQVGLRAHAGARHANDASSELLTLGLVRWLVLDGYLRSILF